jgi:hypothetical protein
MKYVCLVFTEEKTLEALSQSERDALLAEHRDYHAALRKSGHFIAAEPLQPAHTATTVRVRRGRISATDGPFAETKEQLGSFYLIEASDLNDALQVAAKIPCARIGSIEVRPVRECAS